jgi:hypothetical protein
MLDNGGVMNTARSYRLSYQPVAIRCKCVGTEELDHLTLGNRQSFRRRLIKISGSVF